MALLSYTFRSYYRKKKKWFLVLFFSLVISQYLGAMTTIEEINTENIQEITEEISMDVLMRITHGDWFNIQKSVKNDLLSSEKFSDLIKSVYSSLIMPFYNSSFQFKGDNIVNNNVLDLYGVNLPTFLHSDRIKQYYELVDISQNEPNNNSIIITEELASKINLAVDDYFTINIFHPYYEKWLSINTTVLAIISPVFKDIKIRYYGPLGLSKSFSIGSPFEFGHTPFMADSIILDYNSLYEFLNFSDIYDSYRFNMLNIELNHDIPSLNFKQYYQLLVSFNDYIIETCEKHVPWSQISNNYSFSNYLKRIFDEIWSETLETRSVIAQSQAPILMTFALFSIILIFLQYQNDQDDFQKLSFFGLSKGKIIAIMSLHAIFNSAISLILSFVLSPLMEMYFSKILWNNSSLTYNLDIPSGKELSLMFLGISLFQVLVNLFLYFRKKDKNENPNARIGLSISALLVFILGLVQVLTISSSLKYDPYGLPVVETLKEFNVLSVQITPIIIIISLSFLVLWVLSKIKFNRIPFKKKGLFFNFKWSTSHMKKELKWVFAVFLFIAISMSFFVYLTEIYRSERQYVNNIKNFELCGDFQIETNNIGKYSNELNQSIQNNSVNNYDLMEIVEINLVQSLVGGFFSNYTSVALLNFSQYHEFCNKIGLGAFSPFVNFSNQISNFSDDEILVNQAWLSEYRLRIGKAIGIRISENEIKFFVIKGTFSVLPGMYSVYSSIDVFAPISGNLSPLINYSNYIKQKYIIQDYKYKMDSLDFTDLLSNSTIRYVNLNDFSTVEKDLYNPALGFSPFNSNIRIFLIEGIIIGTLAIIGVYILVILLYLKNFINVEKMRLFGWSSTDIAKHFMQVFLLPIILSNISGFLGVIFAKYKYDIVSGSSSFSKQILNAIQPSFNYSLTSFLLQLLITAILVVSIYFLILILHRRSLEKIYKLTNEDIEFLGGIDK
ncbi:MAG: hypothetical protein ACTSWC_12255 [Promethearchaeota archaeon]